MLTPALDGPPASANGGYACGLVAGLLERRRLRSGCAPPPLDTPLSVERDGPTVLLLNGGALVAEGRAASPSDAEPPRTVGLAEAREASARGFERWSSAHPFPLAWSAVPSARTAFVSFPASSRTACSRHRGRPAGAQQVWAALDFPTRAPLANWGEGPPIVLARLHAHLERLPSGERGRRSPRARPRGWIELRGGRIRTLCHLGVGMRPQSDTVEEILARVAANGHGVATREGLLAAGVSASGIKRRLEKGSLLREYPGVYRVGHRAPSVEATYLAAVKACGTGAVLSGRAAGYLHRLLKGAPPPEVTVAGRRKVEGVRTRRSRSVERNTVRGIPVTTVARTLVDLARVLPEEDLARACHEAGVLHRTTPAQVEAVLARRPNALGAKELRRVLRGDVQVTLSKLERRFLQLLREAALPLPRTNKPAGGRRVDCRWPEHNLTVELDSYRYHSSRHSWEQDRRREREARARGDEFRRFTYADVVEEARYMLEELRKLL